VLHPESIEIPYVLHEFSSSPWVGHTGLTRIYKKLVSVFYCLWGNMWSSWWLVVLLLSRINTKLCNFV